MRHQKKKELKTRNINLNIGNIGADKKKEIQQRILSAHKVVVFVQAKSDKYNYKQHREPISIDSHQSSCRLSFVAKRL